MYTLNTLRNHETDQFKGKSIMITGATGIVGYNLIKIFDDLITKQSLKIKIFAIHKQPLPFFMKSFENRVNFIQGDIVKLVNDGTLPDADFIIHGAGYGQPEKFMNDPYLTIEINTFVTNYLLRKTGEKFIFLSSSEIYSGTNKEESLENEVGFTNTDHPRAPYIEGKRLGETLTLLANNELDITSTVARLSLAYGPGVKINDSRVLNQLIYRGLVNKKIELRDSGESIRNYLYITDAVYILTKLLLESKGGIFNVGGKSEVSIKELGKIIAEILQVELTYPQNSFDHISPKRVKLNMTKTQETVGTVNFLEIEKGLLSTIEWYKFLFANN
jgi:nucleoside-diphosphate-sugar epimerase